MLHTFAGICQGNDVKNKAFDYCKTVKAVIEKKIENRRHSSCHQCRVTAHFLQGSTYPVKQEEI